MAFSHCKMCLTTKFPLFCLLLCVPSWIFGSRGNVAQASNQTKPENNTMFGELGSIPQTYHDHDDFQIKESTVSIAREKGKYFASLLFAKYGSDNQTLHQNELVQLFHHLVLAVVEDKEVDAETSDNEYTGDDKIHKRFQVVPDHNTLESHEQEQHDDDDDDDGVLHADRNITFVNTTRSTEKRNIDSNSDINDLKNDKEISLHHAHYNKNGTFSENQTIHVLDHENNLNLTNAPTVIPQNLTVVKQDSKNFNSSQKQSFGKKRKAKGERRSKKGRKQKKNKKNKENVDKRKKNKENSDKSKKRITRGLSKQQNNYHVDRGCLTIKQILEAFDLENKDEITLTDFLYLSPAIIYQLDTENCSHHLIHSELSGFNPTSKEDQDHDRYYDHAHNHYHRHNAQAVDKDGTDTLDVHYKALMTNPGKVWGFSFVAVLIISLVGLVGVGIIPLMQKVFYNHLLQFLVALAVGALTGDALLHLLPHAIGAHATEPHLEEEPPPMNQGMMTYKGLLAVLGIFFFFLMERLLNIGTEIKRKQKSKLMLNRRNSITGSSVYRFEGTPMLGTNLSPQIDSKNPSCDDVVVVVSAKLSSHSLTKNPSCEDMVMMAHRDRSAALKLLAPENDNDVHKQDTTCEDCDHSNNFPELSTSPDTAIRTIAEEHIQMLPKDEGAGHSHGDHHGHGHGHGHGHSHGDELVPDTVTSIAWMVILGDGIHNFCDGLAIGASFAGSITSGFSTTIAVFCHELPHEIGDFAVLLKAGMTVKQAIIYNCVSSILCFFGMFVGIGLGNIHEATSWIFACVAGMFLYIALVDMLPEMTSIDSKKGESPFFHLMFQCSGIAVGTVIMLLIAIYEDTLLDMFEE